MSDEKPTHVTQQVSQEKLEAARAQFEAFRPVPDPTIRAGSSIRPVWRVQLYLMSDPAKMMGLDINGNIVLGRAGEGANFISLQMFGASEKGVSRQHIELRPVAEKLFVIDLGSTNGTRRNDQPIGQQTPYSLVDGDVLTMGNLELVVRILQKPFGHTRHLRTQADLAEALAEMAKLITSQLDITDALDQALESTMGLTSADEAAIWLVDQKTGELFLKAQHGMEGDKADDMRLSLDQSLAGQVVRSGEPHRAYDTDKGVKIRTDYLVEAVIYVPLKLGGVTFGVLGAANRDGGREFSDRDERILLAIGDFSAIAVQNARQYEAADKALAARVKELAAINELTSVISYSLDLRQVYNVLIEHLVSQWHIDGAELWLVNEEGSQFASLPALAAGEDGWRSTNQGIVGNVIREGVYTLANDVKKLPNFDTAIDSIEGFETNSMVCVPLNAGETVVGVLALFNKQEGKFEERDIQKLAGFAFPVATAIRNAQLYTQSEQERETIRGLIDSFPGPVIISNSRTKTHIYNEAAKALVESDISAVLDNISHLDENIGEITAGENTYIATLEETPNIGTIVVMQDITYLKRLERAREEFVQALSHDLKSPVSSVKGYAQLLQVNPSEEKREKYAQRLEQVSERILSMISHLLDYAKLTSSSVDQFEQVDMVALCKDAMTDLSGAALAKSIDVTFQLSGTPKLTIGNKTYLHRSMLNLLDNAIKYSPENTQILLSLLFTPDAVRITVRDDGKGIPEEDLPYIFDRYYRGRQEEGDELGVGLGLELVKATIETHGGTVKVRNVDGHGAEFVVELPSQHADEAD